MTEIATTPEPVIINQPTLVKDTRDRNSLPHRFIDILDFNLEEARASDTELELCIAIVKTGLKKKTIPVALGNDLLVHLFAAFRNINHMLSTLSKLRESGYSVSLDEIERVRKLNREIANSERESKP